ncbi:uncharacterized protein LOC128200096 [Galleria mellonella]|uniref:RNA-directed DNA polymerase n=1 Tax=Galleria mellonella TaxID=7137 RepID=A0ABM3MAW6_GALME|nr:uncharacterized protein LOC128200096 [Galleria mellonella]
MVNLIGPDGFDVYQTFTFDEDSERDDVAVLMKKFDNYFGTKPNVTLMRYKFFTRNQDEGESIQQYVTALRLLSKTCEFTTLEEELIRDRIVCGIRHSTVRDRLLRCDDLNLDKVIKICQAEEVSQESCRQIGSSGDTARVDAVSARGRGRSAARGWPRRAASGAARGINRRGPAADALAPRAARSPCRACGSARCSDSECPAQRVSCYVCGNHGHFARMLNRKMIYIYIWFQILTCENGHENFKLDSGADCNIISYSTFLKLGFDPNIIVKKNISLLSYTHDTIPLKGICTIPWYYKNIIYNLKFAVADIECSSVLGRNSCEELGLIKRIMSIELSNYNDLFKGLGCLPGKYHIVTDSSVPPVICASRKIPHGLRDRLAQELNKMVDLGVIRKVNHPTQWDQVLIPKELREEMLKIVHEGHLGIDRCKRRARQVMFWPSMSRDIEQFVKRCHTCQEHSNRPAKEPLLPMEIPALPWEKVGSDIFEFNREYTIKMILKKSIKSNGDFDLALLNYRNTPRDGLSSPAQLLMGRRLRCQLPVHENLLKPKPVDPSEYQTMLHKQNNNKMYYDQHSKTLPMLREGDSVICIDGKIRSRGKIVGRADTPRSYIVKNSVGARYRRNRRHLIRCESDPQAMHSDHGKDEQFNDACEYSCTSSDEASNLNSEQLIRKAKAVAIQRLRKKL